VPSTVTSSRKCCEAILVSVRSASSGCIAVWFELHRFPHLASACRQRKDFLAMQNQHKTMGALQLIRA